MSETIARGADGVPSAMMPPSAPPTAEIPALYLQNIHRFYRQGDAMLEILKGAELEVWAGQSIALVAQSGVGKSTLLHIAGLLEHPDSGEVYLDKIATSGLSDAERTRIRRSDLGFV